MKVELEKADNKDADLIYKMQVKSFLPLYEKYHDDNTSPAKETVQDVITRMSQLESTYYKILSDGIIVGAVRIRQLETKRYRISPIFILPEYQGQGIAQKVFNIIEKEYSDAEMWELDTILEEVGNCYLYEKLGYKRTGVIEKINEDMTIVFYEKQILI